MGWQQQLVFTDRLLQDLYLFGQPRHGSSVAAIAAVPLGCNRPTASQVGAPGHPAAAARFRQRTCHSWWVLLSRMQRFWPLPSGLVFVCGCMLFPFLSCNDCTTVVLSCVWVCMKEVPSFAGVCHCSVCGRLLLKVGPAFLPACNCGRPKGSEAAWVWPFCCPLAFATARGV